MSICQEEERDIQNNFKKYSYFLNESDVKKLHFKRVLDICMDIETTDNSIIEILFDYKLNDFENQENESKLVTREFHGKPEFFSAYEKQKQRRRQLIQGALERRKNYFLIDRSEK